MISPSSEHLFQTTSQHHMEAWVSAMQETTEEALKQCTVSTTKRPTFSTSSCGGILDPPIYEPIPDAMNIILSVPGNQACADCSSSVGECCHHTGSCVVVFLPVSALPLFPPFLIFPSLLLILLLSPPSLSLSSLFLLFSLVLSSSPLSSSHLRNTSQVSMPNKMNMDLCY